MPSRTKKILKPPLPEKAKGPETPLEHKSYEIEKLARKLERMYIDVRSPSDTASRARAQKSDISQGCVRMSLETIQALRLNVESIVCITNEFAGEVLAQVMLHKFIPFGVIDLPTQTVFADKSLVSIQQYEGHIPILSAIFLELKHKPDEDAQGLAWMSACKEQLMNKLVVDTMSSPCGSFRVFSEKSEPFGVVSAETHIRLKTEDQSDTSAFSAMWTHRILACIDEYFNDLERCTSIGLRICNAVLLAGKSGTGKSSILRDIRRRSTYPTLSIRSLDIDEAIVAFDEESPLVVFFDDIDTWLAVREFPFLDRNTVLRKKLDQWRSKRVFVVLTATDPAVIAEPLKSPPYIDRTLIVPMPKQADERARIIEALIDSTSPLSPADIAAISQQTRGYSPRDLTNLVQLATAHSYTQDTPLTLAHFHAVLKDIRPEAIGALGDTSGIPKVRWSDICGQAEAKQCLQECVKWLTTHASLLKKFNVQPPRGILLYGPPGCSKTMLAKALATECRMHFVSIKGPELLSKWVGDSEKAIRDVFARARAVAPAVLFFDEFDALCGKRSGWSAGDRVISQLLHELDGFHGADDTADEELLIVAATNRPDMIDAALLRPGRFDRKIAILPPSFEDRKEILEMKMRRIEPPISVACIERVAGKMDKFSGADCVAVCADAAMLALQEDMEADTLTEAHLEAALDKFIEQRKSGFKSHL